MPKVGNDNGLRDVDVTAWTFEFARERRADGASLVRIGANVDMTCRNRDEDRKCDRGDGCCENVRAREAHLRLVQGLPTALYCAAVSGAGSGAVANWCAKKAVAPQTATPIRATAESP